VDTTGMEIQNKDFFKHYFDLKGKNAGRSE
jgi:hypothetical protein